MVSNAALFKSNAEVMQTEQFNLNHIIHFKNWIFSYSAICPSQSLSYLQKTPTDYTDEGNYTKSFYGSAAKDTQT